MLSSSKLNSSNNEKDENKTKEIIVCKNSIEYNNAQSKEFNEEVSFYF